VHFEKEVELLYSDALCCIRMSVRISAAATSPAAAVTVTAEPYPEHAKPPVAEPARGSFEYTARMPIFFFKSREKP
jgi:hypothetical protein